MPLSAGTYSAKRAAPGITVALKGKIPPIKIKKEMRQNRIAMVFLKRYLSWSYFIARKFITKEGKTSSRRIFYLAIFSVALSVAIMLLSIATLSGFKKEIQQKISDVQGDFIIDSGRNIESGEPFPLSNTDVATMLQIRDIPGVKRVIPSASKACIIKSEENIEGLMAKGIDSTSTSYFNQAYHVIRQTSRSNGQWCWISENTAKRLNIDTGTAITVVFFVADEFGNSRPRARRLTVTAIYQTGIQKIDAQMILVDQNLLRAFFPDGKSFTQLEIWSDNTVENNNIRKEILTSLPNAYIRLNTLQEYNRLIFDWLAILNTNVLIILVLMALVAITGMSTTLLILIIERTSNIGLLMAMGAKSKDISKMFVIQAMMIAVIGILLGNMLTLGVVYGQNNYHLISLNQDIYFIPYVKLSLSLFDWFWVDLAAIAVIGIALWLPAQYIRKIDLIKAITFK